MNTSACAAPGAAKYVTAFRQIVRDLARAGYDVDEYAALDGAELARRVEQRLYAKTAGGEDKYSATPTELDVFASPRHRVRAPGAPAGDEDPATRLHWKADWQRFVALDLDSEAERPPRVYVHFACFPVFVFKHQHLTAALNNICEQRGATSRDTFVVVTHGEENKKLAMRKYEMACQHAATGGRYGHYVIQFDLEELQVDVCAHVLMPPGRVLHCRRVRDARIARTGAVVRDVAAELPVMSVKDPQARRLFARPGQVIETLETSMAETDMWRYHVVQFPENDNL